MRNCLIASLLFSFIALFLWSETAHAQAGQTRYTGGVFQVYDGSTWDSINYGLGATCGGPQNGVCGSAAGGAATTSQPTTDLCAVGTYVDLSDTSSYWQWRCNGVNGGSNSPTCQRARSAGATCNGTAFGGSEAICRVGNFGTSYAHGTTLGTCQPSACSYWNGGTMELGECTAVSGSCSYTCNNGSWTQNSNSCVCTNCESACFEEGTLISMADGSFKAIEDIKAGDMVLAFDKTKPHSKLEPRKVNATKNSGEQDVMVINGTLYVTESHKFPTLEYGMLEAGRLKFGDHLINENGHKVKVTSIAKKVRKSPTYNMEVDGYHSYVAGGYRTGNMLIKESTIQEYKSKNVQKACNPSCKD